MLYKDQKIFKELKLNCNYLIKIFDDRVCEFFSTLSKNIMQEKNSLNYPELISFAFDMRSKNIKLKKKKYEKENNFFRYPVGKVIHFTPKNAPINFLYSLFFGLITGNRNIIKLPSQKFDQVQIILKLISKILKYKKFNFLKNFIFFIMYNKNNVQLTEKLILNSDLKIIWGGDQSIYDLRKYKSLPRTSEYTFADRYSLCLINYKIFKNLNSTKVKDLVKKFYKDSYTFGQNACNSPHLVIWIGKDIDSKIIEKFWQNLSCYANQNEKDIDSIVYDKFSKVCSDVINFANISDYKIFGKNLSVISLKNLDKNILSKKGKWGYFYQYKNTSLNIIKKIDSKKIQTITYFGFKNKEFKNIFNKIFYNGIDRIVPIGRSFEMENIWDGKNFYDVFTRIIDIK